MLIGRCLFVNRLRRRKRVRAEEIVENMDTRLLRVCLVRLRNPISLYEIRQAYTRMGGGLWCWATLSAAGRLSRRHPCVQRFCTAMIGILPLLRHAGYVDMYKRRA